MRMKSATWREIWNEVHIWWGMRMHGMNDMLRCWPVNDSLKIFGNCLNSLTIKPAPAPTPVDVHFPHSNNNLKTLIFLFKHQRKSHLSLIWGYISAHLYRIFLLRAPEKVWDGSFLRRGNFAIWQRRLKFCVNFQKFAWKLFKNF